jgi:hypothetical protein
MIERTLLSEDGANRKENICEDGEKLEPNVMLAKMTSLAICAYYLFSIILDTYAKMSSQRISQCFASSSLLRSLNLLDMTE